MYIRIVMGNENQSYGAWSVKSSGIFCNVKIYTSSVWYV